MIPVEFHPEAAAELQDGARFYELQRSGLGERFLAAIGFALAGVTDSPMTWPVIEGDLRRRLVRVCPYAVLYSMEADRILIRLIAVISELQTPRVTLGATGT